MRDAAVSEGLPIGAFAAAAGVNVETVRYYQRKGLLSEPEKPYGSIRRYGEADVARVKFVKSAQRLGFTLDEVAVLLTLEDGMHCGHKLTDVRSKLADLRRIESVLAQLVRECGQARGKVSCPLVTALQGR
jgi:MerR family transcriptional regulator, mercuric resistance operon regulatory protein